MKFGKNSTGDTKSIFLNLFEKIKYYIIKFSGQCFDLMCIVLCIASSNIVSNNWESYLLFTHVTHKMMSYPQNKYI